MIAVQTVSAEVVSAGGECKLKGLDVMNGVVERNKKFWSAESEKYAATLKVRPTDIFVTTFPKVHLNTTTPSSVSTPMRRFSFS